MDNSTNITKKLNQIVKKRNTPIIENKQENGYKRKKKSSGTLAFDSYYQIIDD